MQELLRFLSLVRARLDAVDARVEIGGEPPEESALWAPIADEMRVVARLPAEVLVTDAHKEHLRSLVQAFQGLHEGFATVQGKTSTEHRAERQQRALDDALELLREKAGAAVAFVLDSETPELWGRTAMDLTPDNAWVVLARQHLREEPSDETAVGRTLSVRILTGKYHLVLGFEAEPSQLRSDAAFARAHRAIEKLVLALPPRKPGTDPDQPPGVGARVARIRRLRRV